MAKIKIVRIVSKVDGRRRAGIAHPGTATDHPADAFTAAQLAQLNADPMLIVQELEVEVADDKDAKAPSGGRGGKAAS